MRKSKHDIPALLKNVTHCDDLWITKEFEYNPFLSSGSKKVAKKKAFSSCDFELLEIYNEDVTEILITL